MSLSWNPPPADSQNGIIISYHLNLTTLATGSVSLYTSYDTTIQVNGLVPYTTYTCLIAAETSIGRGPYTTIDPLGAKTILNELFTVATHD